jgi:hypothetical protein
MTTLYKLTDQKGMTYSGFRWQVGVTEYLEPVKNPELCSGDVFHAYTNSNLGLLLNPSHANIKNPRLFEADGEIVVEDWSKVGCFDLTLTKELPLPEWYQNSNIRKTVVVQFAILCAEAVLHIYEAEYPYDKRPRAAVEAAQNYLNNPSEDAAHAANAAAYAAYAADAAAYAADAAAYAADAAAYAAYAADAAAYAAYAAANAAARAADIDFGYLADKAVELVTGK